MHSRDQAVEKFLVTLRRYHYISLDLIWCCQTSCCNHVSTTFYFFYIGLPYHIHRRVSWLSPSVLPSSMLGLTHNSRHTTLRQISFLVSSGDLWTSLVSCRSNWDKSPVPELSSNITTSLKLMSIIMRLRLLLEIVWFMSQNFSSIERKWFWIINWHLIATWSMKDILLLRYPSIVKSVRMIDSMSD